MNLILTILKTLFIDQAPLRLLHPLQIRNAAFANFWNALFSGISSNQQTHCHIVQPPQEPDTSALPGLLSNLHGTILELGPGTGTQTAHLDAAKVMTVYLAEPTVELHSQLRANVEAAGLGGAKSRILVCGAEEDSLLPALAREVGLKRELEVSSITEVFDAIVCARVLCCVPRQAQTARNLYALLKPGGRLVVREHVVGRVGGLGRALQWAYMGLGWRWWMVGCCLDRDTEKALRDAAAESDGGWHVVDLKRETEWGVLPFITGVLVKKGKSS
ncbi:MAG: hypothetical protein M1825_003820 [Sarcosagium campestre]|nr:MAG: hypothetical protein M1825_003820 [Sarcosagium campestre]